MSDDTDTHMLVCAPTGTGKGKAFAIPALLSWTGGTVVVDVKGELYNVTARYRRSIGPVVAIDPFLDATDGSGSFNPLSILDPRKPGYIDDALAFAGLFSNPSSSLGKDGPFWENHGSDVIAGTTAHVFSLDAEEDRSVGRVYELLHGDDTVYDLAVLCDKEIKHPFAQQRLARFLSLPDLTRGGVQATFSQQLRLLASPEVRAALATNTLDLDDIVEGKPFTIYLIWPPDRLESHAALLRVFLTGLTNLLMRRRRKPLTPTLLLVDEAAQIGRIPALVSATTLGRGYGIRIAWMFQSYGQLAKAYPNDHEAIAENAGTVVTFGKHKAFSMSRTLAERLFGDVTAEAVFGLAAGDVMLRRAGEPTRVLRQLNYLKDAMFRGRFDPNPLHVSASR